MLGVAAFVSLVPILLAAPPVRLDADGACPDAARVTAELEAIVTAREDAPPPTDTAKVTTRDGVLTIRLTGPDGALLGERKLRADGDCDARARAVAVILATFLTDRHPEYLTLLPAAVPEDASSQPTTAEPEASAPAPPTASPEAQIPAPPAPEPEPAPRSIAQAPRPAPVPTKLPSEWLLTAAAGVQLTSEIVPAGSISLSFLPGARGLGVRAFALAGGQSERTLGAEVAAYSRFPFGVGPMLRLGQRDGWLDAAAGVAVGWLHVAGRTFSSNTSADDVVVGPFASLRAGTEWLAVRPFAEAGALVWPGESVLVARSPEASAELPVLDAFFLLGVGFAL